jgi:hypothetical protein
MASFLEKMHLEIGKMHEEIYDFERSLFFAREIFDSCSVLSLSKVKRFFGRKTDLEVLSSLDDFFGEKLDSFDYMGKEKNLFHSVFIKLINKHLFGKKTYNNGFLDLSTDLNEEERKYFDSQISKWIIYFFDIEDVSFLEEISEENLSMIGENFFSFRYEIDENYYKGLIFYIFENDFYLSLRNDEDLLNSKIQFSDEEKELIEGKGPKNCCRRCDVWQKIFRFQKKH